MFAISVPVLQPQLDGYLGANAQSRTVALLCQCQIDLLLSYIL